MAVLMMKAVPLNHAVLMVLVFIPLVCCQDHQLLTENCNWDATNWVKSTRGSKVTLTSPAVNLVSNLVCRTRFYINDLSYTLKMRVRLFDLKGSNDCGRLSEMITLQFSDVGANKNISWCGAMYPEEMILPVRTVNLTYNTGAFGEGAGFQLEFSAVPLYSCYDERKLEVTTQPKLLYSPNFPGHYKSYLSCDVQLHAKEDQYIHIQSLLVQIENSVRCEFDALTINNVSYCGQDPIDVVVPASTVDIKFVSDGSKEFDGFILKYVALQTEILNCTSAEHYEVTARDFSTVVVLENHAPSDRRKPYSSPQCQVLVESGSDDKVLDLMLLPSLSDVASYILVVDGETGFSQSGKLTIDSPGPYPYQDSGAITFNFLRSPGRRVSFSVLLQTGKFMFRMQAADPETLPDRVLARHSLVWVSTDLARSQEISQIFVMPAGSGENVEVDVFYTDRDHASLDREADRLPVASYALVYNGEDTSYFQLTRGCSANRSRQARSVYSIGSQNVTVVVTRNAMSRGFWLYFAPSDNSYLPQPEELSISTNFSTFITQVNIKNLYCKWTLSESSQLDLVGNLIRLRAESNFDPDSLDQSFIVKEEEINVLRYTKTTPSDIWMYSSKPISITVSVFSNAVNLRPLYFRFTSGIVDRGNDIQPLYCLPQNLQANETVQFAATPNYPAFFQNDPCVWTISQNTESGRRDTIVVEFPDQSNFPCSQGNEFQILTRNSGEDFLQRPGICGVSLIQRRYQNDQVKIMFVSGYQSLLPGFKFTYYTEISHTRDVTLVATEEFQFLSSPYYPVNYPSSIDYQWLITTGSDSSVIDLDLMDFVLEEEVQTQCIHDYVEIYDGSSATTADRIETMCGSVFYRQYSSTGSDLTVVFHSDALNNYKGFRFKYHSREKKLNVVGCRQNITGIIIGVIAGSVVLLILIVGVIIYMLRRRKRQRSNTNSRVSVPGAGRRGPMSRRDRSGAIMNGVPISPSAPPSYWEIDNSYANNDPPSYSSVHSSADFVVPEYAPGYISGQPGINLLGLPPPYSIELPSSTLQPDLYLELVASRLQSPSLYESTDSAAQPDPHLPAALRDRDDCHPYDMINDSVCDSNPTADNTTTSNATQAVDNNQVSDRPPAYETGSYVQITGGHGHDPRRVPHIKNDRLGFL